MPDFDPISSAHSVEPQRPVSLEPASLGASHGTTEAESAGLSDNIRSGHSPNAAEQFRQAHKQFSQASQLAKRQAAEALPKLEKQLNLVSSALLTRSQTMTPEQQFVYAAAAKNYNAEIGQAKEILAAA